MPKAILEFQLPAEEEAHEDALNGTLWHSVACDIDKTLRDWIKYGIPKDLTIEAFTGRQHPVAPEEWIQAVRDALFGTIDNHGLRLHD